MVEIELKFQVPPAARSRVDAAVAGRTPGRRLRLQAAYCDTPSRLLARAGIALRVRREGRLWVQTLKRAADDGMTRQEHNVPLGAAVLAPTVDPARHAGTPIGERLLALLAAHPGEALGVRYRTDVLRRTRVRRAAGGRVELAFDEGRIAAVDGATPALTLCELEIELKAGSPQAVISAARGWSARFGLWLDNRSKAERGDLLAGGATLAAPRLAKAVALFDDLSLLQMRQQVLRSCADQVIGNASQVATGTFAAEHVHQLRIGLRRLRSALRLFDPSPDEGVDLGEAAARLFRELGVARDDAVIGSAFAADLATALRSAGLPGDAPRALPTADATDPAMRVRAVACQSFLLDLLAVTTVPINARPDATGRAAADALAQRLERWHRRAAADSRRYDELDDAGRHRLRKRVKRLRYAVEFCAALFPRRAVRGYLRPLRELQERLGEINDVVMAMQAFRRGSDADPRALFALGWLASQRDAVIAAARPELKAFVRADRFWKRR